MLLFTLIVSSVVIYSLYQQRNVLDEKLNEIEQASQQALAVKKDLESIMTEALLLSNALINNLETNVSKPLHTLHDLPKEDVCAIENLLATRHFLSDTVQLSNSFQLNKTAESEPLPIKTDPDAKTEDKLSVAFPHYSFAENTPAAFSKQDMLDDSNGESTFSVGTVHTGEGNVLKSILNPREFLSALRAHQQADKNTDQETRNPNNAFADDLSDLAVTADNHYQQIRLLHETGMSITEIARQMQKSQGEISLMLSIAKKKKVV